MKIQDYLQTHNLLVDGAFGTYYAEKYRTQNIPELENIEHPEQIQAVHADYLAAGATMIRTNTFIANTVALQKIGIPLRHKFKLPFSAPNLQ